MIFLTNFYTVFLLTDKQVQSGNLPTIPSRKQQRQVANPNQSDSKSPVVSASRQVQKMFEVRQH